MGRPRGAAYQVAVSVDERTKPHKFQCACGLTIKGSDTFQSHARKCVSVSKADRAKLAPKNPFTLASGRNRPGMARGVGTTTSNASESRGLLRTPGQSQLTLRATPRLLAPDMNDEWKRKEQSLLVNLIVGKALPLSLVSSRQWREYISHIAPYVPPTCRNKLSQVSLTNAYHDAYNDAVDELMKCRDVAFMTDGTRRDGIHYVNFCLNGHGKSYCFDVIRDGT